MTREVNVLVQWLKDAARVAGATDVDEQLLGKVAESVILDLARDAAHSIARPAAPLAAFAVGLAIGRSGGGVQELREIAEAVASEAIRQSQAEGQPAAS